jgi:hypothetical protein
LASNCQESFCNSPFAQMVGNVNEDDGGGKGLGSGLDNIVVSVPSGEVWKVVGYLEPEPGARGDFRTLTHANPVGFNEDTLALNLKIAKQNKIDEIPVHLSWDWKMGLMKKAGSTMTLPWHVVKMLRTPV